MSSLFPSRERGSNMSTEIAGIEVEVCNGKQQPGNLLLYFYQEGEKKRGQAAEGLPKP